MSSTYWKTISESPYPWEREGLDFVRAGLPDREPFRVWSLFEFTADDGTINEVDFLALTPAGFFLVEIKSDPGLLRGDSGTWTFEHDGRIKTIDNPLLLANRKAKRLKSLLLRQPAVSSAKHNVRIPFLEALVFCSAPDLKNELSGTAACRVCFRDQKNGPGQSPRPGILAALVDRKGPGIETATRSVIDAPLARALSRAMDQAGIRQSQRSRKVGDLVMDHFIGDGPGYQEWVGVHASMKNVERRIRIYPVRLKSSPEERRLLERAARREFQLLESLRSPGVLQTHDFQEHELGPALIFEHPANAIRLDHLMAQRGETLSPSKRLNLLQDTAEVIRFAHRKKIVHRALAPQSILVLDPESEHPLVKVFNWQVGYRLPASAGERNTPMSTNVHASELVENAASSFMAPEAFSGPDATGEHLDVFSLGALAYFLFSGRPPADDAVDLSRKLRESRGLQISAVVNGAGQQLSELIRLATHPDVSVRLESVDTFLLHLDGVRKELASPEPEQGADPLHAGPDDVLQGGYKVIRRLGTGGFSVALLVEKDGKEQVLKVANDPEHNERIKQEFEVLQKLRHPHIVQARDTVELGEYVGLVMDVAGKETLAQRLRADGRLQVELLQRFGEDLLQVLVYLEEQGFAHRDIKPSNIGIREVGRDDRLHLILFDFSLSRTPPENIHAGTQGYLDPFLSLRRPPRWDLQSERFTAAVTLYEMATGSLPTWGDGRSDPALLDCEATIDAELFDAGTRDGLSGFFEQALRRDHAMRFDNAEQMLATWRRAFAGLDRSRPGAGATERAVPFVDRQLLEAATLETQMPELGLTARTTNALDRINVLTVRDLLTLNISTLRRLKGVGHKTRSEILEVVGILRPRLAPDGIAGGGPPSAEPKTYGIDSLAKLLCVGTTSRKAGPALIPALLGLDSNVPLPWPSQADLARQFGITRAGISQAVSRAVRRWDKIPELADIRQEIDDLIREKGGIAAIDELGAALLLTRPPAIEGPQAVRFGIAVVRAAVETERAGAARFFDSRQPHRVFILSKPELSEYAKHLGDRASTLSLEDPLVPPARVVEELRRITTPLPQESEESAVLTDARLVQLAALASATTALSTRGELYPRGMEALRAIKLSQGALFGPTPLSVAMLRDRVSSRYPEAEPLPDRPDLDRLLQDAGLNLEWCPDLFEGKGGYRSRLRDPLSLSSATSTPTRLATEPGPTVAVREVTPEVASARQFEERLKRALVDGAFLAMSVAPKHYLDARRELGVRFPVETTDFEALLLGALRNEAERHHANWETVLKADAEPSGSVSRTRLLSLVRGAMPRVKNRIVESTRTVLLVYPGLLFRYEQVHVLEELRDLVGRRGTLPGLWVLIPADDQQAFPFVDGKAVPILASAQQVRIPESWIRNEHRSNGLRGARP